MFDTMTMTKTVGAVCGSLLVLMLVGWAGNSLYTVGAAHHGEHAEGELTQAYTIDTGEAAAPAEGGGETVDVAALLAAGDAAAGEAVFKKCGSCHKLDGTSKTAPHLNGVVGRNHASVGDFEYSEDCRRGWDKYRPFLPKPWPPNRASPGPRKRSSPSWRTRRR